MLSTRELARLLTGLENGDPDAIAALASMPAGEGLCIGITGPPGAGKSSLVDAITAELRQRGKTVAILAIDPTSRITGGAILGDRIRMQKHHADSGVFIRSMATRGANGGLAKASGLLSRLFAAAGFDYVIVETVGVGQDEVEIAGLADVTVVVLVPGMGDDVQAIKAGVMEIAQIFVINKADRPGADLTQRELESMLSLGDAQVPIFRTVAIDGTGVAELVNTLTVRTKRTDASPEAFVLDHLGIAVQSIDTALEFCESLGMTVTSRETVAHEGVHVAMLPAGESRVELLEPVHADSVIGKYLAKRGPGLHHVAVKVQDLRATAARLQASGVRLLGEPKRGAGGHLYVFVHPASSGGVLWELIQA